MLPGVAPSMPHLAGVEHHHELLDGVRIHYAEAGPQSGAPVVLVHGWPQHWWMWRGLIGPLADRGYRVIAPDLRGHGWSSKPAGDYRKDVLMRDILGLLDRLGIERVRVVGHDWGAYIGLLAALRHPDRIERFVALALPHPWQKRRPSEIVTRGWYQVVLSAPVLGKLAIGRLGFTQVVLTKARARGSFTDEELETYLSVTREPDAVEASMRMYRHFLLHELPPILSGSFDEERLSVPTRWIVGAQDPVSGNADEGYRRHADAMTLERVPGLGHFLPEEAPELVRERVLAFL
jgi:pimeloyl-ACP methyl ester carboxylesterase